MKFILKPSKKGVEKDFISKVSDDIDSIKELINEANGIKRVLEKHKKNPIYIDYKEDYSSGYIVKIKMDNLMVDYLKDRLYKVENKSREMVI